MSITQPSPLPGAPTAGATASDLRSQPAVGVVGVLVASTLCLVLGVLIRPIDSLQILGAVTTFSLPVLIASALWWHGWPARGSSRAASGLLNTALIAGLAVILTAVAQVIVGRGDLAHLLSSTPAGHALGRPPFPSFPWTLPLAALIFLAMIQLTFVCDRRPLRRLGTARAGVAAIVLSWIIGVVAYELLANWNAVVPPVAQSALGLSNPGGPVGAFNLLAWTLCVAVWSVVLFIPLRGRAFAAIGSVPARLLAGNATTLALGWGMFLLLSGPLGLTVPEIAAACGVIIAASLVATLIFEGWPARRLGATAARDGVLLATIALLAAGLFIALKALGDARTTWPPADPVYLWMTVCALNFVAAGSILWYGVWRRWPVAAPGAPAEPAAEADR
jgi:hypothetical protein